jgi:hypothetical protein
MADELSVASDGPTRRKEKLRKQQLQRQLKVMLKDPWLVTTDTVRDFHQSHRCIHTKRVLSLTSEQVIRAKYQYSGDGYYDHTYTFCNGSLLQELLGSDPLNSGAWNSENFQASVYRKPDWFALLDSFNEATNSLIPSSTLLGESMVENGIFIDAFKIILNPLSAAKVLATRLKKVYRRGMTLGGLRRTTKDGANAYLGYQFGVAPAITEVRRALSAHKVVGNRLKWLQSNAGGYVPIRVRSKLDSTIENEDLAGRPQGSRVVLCDRKDVVATISAWMKVREDLNFAADWKAYIQYFGLHKVVGLAWELVPMSFVIDWFTNAQEYINRWTTPNFANPFYNMRGLCHSLKETKQVSMYLTPGYYFASDSARAYEPSTPFKVGSLTTSSYTRLPSLPDSSGAVDFSNLGLFHYVTLGAMLLQKKL